MTARSRSLIDTLAAIGGIIAAGLSVVPIAVCVFWLYVLLAPMFNLPRLPL